MELVYDCGMIQIRDVPLAEARRHVQEDLRSAAGTHYDLANWRIKADRLALCRYLLTRELLGADVGSVVMFAIPQDGSLVRPGVEHFLHTMPHEVRVDPPMMSRLPGGALYAEGGWIEGVGWAPTGTSRGKR